MWRFSSGKRKEVWDEEVEGPIDDIDAAHRIRDICRSATESAEKIGGSAGQKNSRSGKYEHERYQRATRAAMEIAIKIADDLLRDASLRQIVGLCVTADDLNIARILFRAVQAPSIREDLLRDHPALRQ
jgi:hypothetical protein